MKVTRNSIICLVLSLSLFMFSCDSVDKVVGTLDNAITALEKQSGNWQIVLKDLEDTLIKEGQETLANEVKGIAETAISDVGIEARCYTDFLRDRVRFELIKLRARYTNEKVNIPPVFCLVNPSIVDYEQVQDGSITSIRIDGYNMSSAGVKLLLDEGGERRNVTSALNNPSDYLMTVRFGGQGGLHLTPASNELIFQFPDGSVQSVGISHPPPMTILSYSLSNDTYQVWFGGGGGGKEVKIECPRGTIGVGITGRSGGRVDRIGLMCGELKSDGSITNITPLPQQAGGNGGTIDISLNCPPNKVLTGMHGRAFAEVDRVGATCATIQDLFKGLGEESQAEKLPSEFGGQGGDEVNAPCDKGYVISGITPWSGDRIDSLRISCTRVVRTEAKQ